MTIVLLKGPQPNILTI